MTPFYYGLGALLGYGFSNFFIAKVSEKIGGFKSTLFAQVLFFLLAFCLSIFFGLEKFQLDVFLKLSVPGVLCVLGVFAYTTAFSKGAIAIVTPIASSWALVTSTLSILFLGEKITLPIFIGIVLTIIGVVVVSTDFKQLIKSRKVKLLSGASWASLTALLFGLGFFFLAKVSMQTDSWFMVTIEMRFWMVVTVLILLPFFKVKNLFSSVPWKLLLFSTIFDIFAAIMFNIGLTHRQPSVVSVLSGASPIVTILLSTVLEKEKLSKVNIVGIIISIAGILLLSV